MTHVSGSVETPKFDESIPSRFESQVERYADRLAVRSRARAFSYAELNSFANALAREILDTAPIAPEGPEPVAVLLPRGIEAIAALLAVLKAGKIHVGLDPGLPPDSLIAQFADSQARIVVTESAQRDVAELLGARSIVSVKIPNDISICANLGLGLPGDAPAAIQYTSGSTGTPKGVLTPHCNIVHNATSPTGAGRLDFMDRILPNRLLTSLNGLMNGACVFPYSVKQEGLGSLGSWLVENEITVMSIVPTMFRRFAATLGENHRFPRLRLIKLTGEALHSGDVELFRRHFAPGCFLQFSFATTETGGVASRLIGHDDKVDGDVVPVGSPVPGKEVLIFNDDGSPAGAGEAGEIAVRSRYIALGYWRKPDLTQERFLSNPENPAIRTYLTGDLGRIGSDGMLVHLGRKDFQVKIRANRVELADVEAAMRSVDGVRDAVVVARPDGSGEMCLAAYFLPSVAPAPPFALVRRALAAKLPDYMVPTTVTMLEQFPLLPNGKVDRRALPDPVPAVGRMDPGPPPRTPMELLVAESWRTVLHLERISASDNFFDLGGNSLAAVEALLLLERKTGVRLGPFALASQTLAQVAAVYEDRRHNSRPGLLPALRRFLGR